MAKRSWAREAVEKYVARLDGVPGMNLEQTDVELLLRAERARTRRVIRQYKKSISEEALDDILRRLR